MDVNCGNITNCINVLSGRPNVSVSLRNNAYNNEAIYGHHLLLAVGILDI